MCKRTAALALPVAPIANVALAIMVGTPPMAVTHPTDPLAHVRLSCAWRGGMRDGDEGGGMGRRDGDEGWGGVMRDGEEG